MKKDTITKDYMSDTAVFADVFNYYIYGGEQVIRPECLTEQDPVKIALPYGTEGAAVPVQKLRVIQKLYAAMTDGKAEYVLCGGEGAVHLFFTAPSEDIIFCWSRGRPGQMCWPPY